MRDAHLPSLARLNHLYEIVAMCSRSGDSARKLAANLPGSVSIYTDPAELLARDDIDAVDIVLPIDSMAAVIEQALRSGKHLISEKPLAGDTQTGRRLLGIYQQSTQQFPDQQWMVAENWRYEEAFLITRNLVAGGEIGRPLTFQWSQHVAMTPSNKYFHTPWRRIGNLAGGFLLDVGVHHASALRFIFGEVASVTADVDQFSPDLPPVDTLAATIRMKNGMLGSYLLSFVTASAWQPMLHIVGHAGSIRVQRGFVEVTKQGESRQIECSGMNGVEKELEAFGRTLLENQPHRNPPSEALQDLLVVEAMLKAAESGQRCAVEQLE